MEREEERKKVAAKQRERGKIGDDSGQDEDAALLKEKEREEANKVKYSKEW